MKQQDVFKKIGGILKELNEQYNYLDEDTAELNELELELFAANASFLKDHTEILRKLTAKNVTAPKPGAPAAPAPAPPKPVEIPLTTAKAPEPPQPPAANREKFFEPVVQRLTPAPNTEVAEKAPEYPYANNIPAPATHEDADAQQEPETIRHELIIDDADTWEDEDEELYDGDDLIEEEEEKEEAEDTQLEDEGIAAEDEKTAGDVDAAEVAEYAPETPESVTVELEPAIARPPASAPPELVKPEPAWQPPVAVAAKPPAEKAPAPEVKKEEQPVYTINQRISEQRGENNAPVQAPVSDLKAAITLNDKLLFVKDLFNGYSLAYSEAIEILNRFNSFEEAQRFLNANYVAKNNWEGKPATSQKFYELLQRRYA